MLLHQNSILQISLGLLSDANVQLAFKAVRQLTSSAVCRTHIVRRALKRFNPLQIISNLKQLWPRVPIVFVSYVLV